nr:hypothetical protein [Tanacetum cinerariifolium]
MLADSKQTYESKGRGDSRSTYGHKKIEENELIQLECDAMLKRSLIQMTHISLEPSSLLGTLYHLGTSKKGLPY